MPIVIVIEGDRVAEIASDDPRLIGQQVAIMDYDTDAATPDQIKAVRQSDASVVGAVGRLMTIVPAAIDLPDLLNALDKS